MRFYRIIDKFIDQAGVQGVSSVWGGAFDDDPGGLALKHDKPGLLSAANSGPDTNSGHFSIVVAPAPHLNGGYTIFGEVVEGIDVVYAINKLTTKGTDRVTGDAIVSAAGCLRSCEPRNVQPKCAQRAKELTSVQGRPMHACTS
uniref:Peptidyl-prolyl cis-trans isomerase n=2 Tax=Calcidiscus leptoporus TaxID=127549 RepID=A0A7S0NSW6_9EUKA|mmetsp:Transcript_19741/g.45444  ORF Transcript_19741/g.45444 Transcript_19741/m.45444 type:complete len:144 (+) Transcript_19741:149-580(+)